jgi:hypothetical protein
MVGSIASYDLTNRKLELPPKSGSPWARETKPSPNDPHVNDLAGTSIARGKKKSKANHFFYYLCSINQAQFAKVSIFFN